MLPRHVLDIDGLEMTTVCLGYYVMHQKIDDTHGLRWFLDTHGLCDGSSLIDGYVRRWTAHRQSKDAHGSKYMPKLRSMRAENISRHVFDRLLLESKNQGYKSNLAVL